MLTLHSCYEQEHLNRFTHAKHFVHAKFLRFIVEAIVIVNCIIGRDNYKNIKFVTRKCQAKRVGRPIVIRLPVTTNTPFRIFNY